MSEVQQVPIEYIVSKYMVKYSRLDELIPDAYAGSKASNINIYIDLYGLYTTIISRTYRTNLSDYTSLTSTIVNVCAHYREYFKKIRVYAKIFIVSGFNVPSYATQFVAGYNKTMQEKLANNSVEDLVSTNIGLLQALTPYLPYIYFLHTDETETSVLIRELINKEIQNGNTNPNMIISTDIYPMQLTSEFPQTTFLRPRKYNGIDSSLIVYPREHPGYVNSFWGAWVKRDSLENSVNTMNVHPINFPLVCALNRLPERGLKNLCGLMVVNRILGQIIGGSDNKVDITTIYSASNEIVSRIPQHIAESRYKVIDLLYQSLIYEETAEFKSITYFDKQDIEAVNMINAAYFKNNPIDLSKL